MIARPIVLTWIFPFFPPLLPLVYFLLLLLPHLILVPRSQSEFFYSQLFPKNNHLKAVTPLLYLDYQTY